MDDELVRNEPSEVRLKYIKRKPLIPALRNYLNDGGTINSYVEYCLELMGKMSSDEIRRALVRFHAETSPQVDFKKIPHSLLVALNEKYELVSQSVDTIDDAQKIALFSTQELVIRALRYKDAHNEVERIISTAPNESKEDLKGQIEQLIDTSNQWQSKFLEIEQARQKAQEHIDNKVAEREAFKEKWAIWRSFLEKESVSTILGAFLLLIIVICLIVTTFTHTTTPQILNDGFLVLLGYFFGQTAANAIKKDKGD